MDRKGGKSNGSQTSGVSKENAAEKPSAKKKSALPLKLSSIQRTKDTKSNVHQSKVSTKNAKANRNVSLVSVKSRRSVGFNAEAVAAKAVEAEDSVAVEKRRRNIRPALLPRNLKGRGGNSYCLVENRRSFGPEYHPDIPSKKKSASKLGMKVFGNNKSVVAQAKENIESPKNDSRLRVFPNAHEKTQQKKPQIRAQRSFGKAAQKSSHGSTSGSSLSATVVSRVAGNGLQSRAKERLKTADNKPQLGGPANRTKTLSRFVSGLLPYVHDTSGSRKSHSDKQIIRSDLNESCVSDQGQTSTFVSPLRDDGFRVGQVRDKPAEQSPDHEDKPFQCKDTDHKQTHDKHDWSLSGSDSINGKLTDDALAKSAQNQCKIADNQSEITDISSPSVYLCPVGDEDCKQVGESKCTVIKISGNSDGCDGTCYIQTVLPEGNALNGCIMSIVLDSAERNCLQEESGEFTKQASHTLSRKFTWFKDDRADLRDTEDVSREIECQRTHIDNNKSNTSSKYNRRDGKLVRQRQRLVTGRTSIKNGNITHKVSTSDTVNSTARPGLGGESSASGGVRKLSEYSSDPVHGNTCVTYMEKRTGGPGTMSMPVRGGNSRDKELAGLKKPSKPHTDNALAVDTSKDSLPVSHYPPGEIRSHSHVLQHDGLELEAETLSENPESISSQLSSRVDWTDVDFTPYYYNSETEVDSPPRRKLNIERKRVAESNYGHAESGFCPRETIDSHDSPENPKEIEAGRLCPGNTSVRYVGEGKSASVNHSCNQATTRRHCRDESPNTNSLHATELQVQGSTKVEVSEQLDSAESLTSSPSSSSSSSCSGNCLQCSRACRPTCADLERTGHGAAWETSNGPTEDFRQRLSPGAHSGKCDTDSDVRSVDLVCTASRIFHLEYNEYDSLLTGVNDVNIVSEEQNKHTGRRENLEELSASSDISSGNLQLATDTGCPSYSSGLGQTVASLRPSRRRQRRPDRSQPTDHATGIGDKYGAHVSVGNAQGTGVGLRRNNVKYVPVNSVSTTTEQCCECGECLFIQTDDQDQVRYLFLSHIDKQCDATCTCSSSENPDSHASDISAVSHGEGIITNAGKTLGNMTDNKARPDSARLAAEKLRSGSESQAACGKQPGVTAKNRSLSAARAVSSRSAGAAATSATTHNAATSPRARGANTEAPVSCKCRERAAELKLSKLKKTNGCRNNCPGNDRSGSRSRSQSAASASSRDSESRQKKPSCAAKGEKRTDGNSMEARPARKLASSRAGAGIKEITSPRSSKLTSKSERTDIGEQDRTMSKQSAVKPVDGQGRLKITRPRSGGHKPDPRVRAVKEGRSTDRSDVSTSSCAARKSPSPREKSAEPSKDTVRTKGSLVKGDKTEPSSNKPTSKVSSKNVPQLARPTSSTRNTAAGAKKVSPRTDDSLAVNSQPSDGSRSPGHDHKTVPRYCSGSTVSSRNKSVRLAKTGSPRESGVETNSKRDQSVSDTSAAGKSYSSRKSIPGTQNCKINSTKPSRIINKSKCSTSSSAAKKKSEDAESVCDSGDLLPASPAADEIQNSNSNCDSASDAAIKTSDKLAVIETPGDRELSEKRGNVDSLGWDVYPEERGDSKDGADKDDSVCGSGCINTTVDPSPERLNKGRGKGLSSEGTNCEARYAGHPAASSAKRPEQKRQSKVTAPGKVFGTSAGISRQSTLSKGTSDDVDPKNRDSPRERSAVTSSTTSKSKCVVGKRKSDAMKTGRPLSSESGTGSGSAQASGNRHAKVTIAKPSATLPSGLEKCSSVGQGSTCIPKPSKGSAQKGVTPQGTESHPEPSTPTVAARHGDDADTRQDQSGHGPREKASSALLKSPPLVMQGCDKITINTTPTQQLDLEPEGLRSNTEKYPTVIDKAESQILKVEKAAEAVQKPNCEVCHESTGCLNEWNNHELSEVETAEIVPQEKNNKITNAHRSLCKHRTPAASNDNEDFPVEKPMLAKNDNGKQGFAANPGSLARVGVCSKEGFFVGVDTHLLTQSSVGGGESETPGQVHSGSHRETEARVKEGFMENRRNGEKVLQKNTATTGAQDKHSTTVNITGHHGEKIVTTGSSLHIRLASGKEKENAVEGTGSKQSGGFVSRPAHFNEESCVATPAKLKSVSVSCLNWNPKNSHVEEKPRVLSEAAVMSTPKLERSAICFTPSVHTKLIPTTVRLNNLCGVLNINMAEGRVGGAEEANVQIPKQSVCENSSGTERLSDLTSEVQSDSNSKPSVSKVTQIQCQVETPKCASSNIQLGSGTHASSVGSEAEGKVNQINPIHSSDIKGVPKRTKVVRKIPVFSGNSGATPKNSADIVITCNGNCSVEVEVSRPKSKSAQRVQAKRMTYDTDYSGKKKLSQMKRLPKELSKSNPDIREQTDTVTVQVTKSKPSSKVKQLASEKSGLLIKSANKELSKSSPNLMNTDSAMIKLVSPRHNPLKGKNCRKNLVYSGLVKKIAMINTPMKNRCKSNPDITKDLDISHLEKESVSKSQIPTKSPRPKTGTVRKIKAKKSAVDSPKSQILSKQKSKSTPDLRDILGGRKSPITTTSLLQGDAICGKLVKNNKMNIMKFSANFYADISAKQDDSEASLNSGDICTDDDGLEDRSAGKSHNSNCQILNVLSKQTNTEDFQAPLAVSGDLTVEASVLQDTRSLSKLDFTEAQCVTGEQNNSGRIGKSQIPSVKTSQLKILTSSKSISHLRSNSPRTGHERQISTVNVDMVSRSSHAERLDKRISCSNSSSEMNNMPEAMGHCVEDKEPHVISELDSDAAHFSQVTFDPICTSTGEFQPFNIAELEQAIGGSDKQAENNAVSETEALLAAKPEEESDFMQGQQPDVFPCAQNVNKGSDVIPIVTETDMAPEITMPEIVPLSQWSYTKSKKVGPKVSPKSREKRVNHDDHVALSKLEDAKHGTITDLSPLSDRMCEECTDTSSAHQLPLCEPDLQVFDGSVGACPADVEHKNTGNETGDELFYSYESEAAVHTDQGHKPNVSPQTLPRVSGRYTEAQLRKIRSEGKSLLEKRSRVPKGLVEDTVNVLATHLEGLLQGSQAGCHVSDQHVESTHSKVANSGESKVNFLKKRFESEQSSQDFRKQRAIERSRVKKKKVPRPLSVQIMDTGEGQQKLDSGTGRHSVVMSTSTDSSVSRDSGFPNDPDCLSVEFMRPTEWRERPVSMTDSDMTSGSEMQYADYLMFENPEEDVLDEALMSPNPDHTSLDVEGLALRRVDSELTESVCDQNANDILQKNRAENFVGMVVSQTKDMISNINDVNSNFLHAQPQDVELSDSQNQDSLLLTQKSGSMCPYLASENPELPVMSLPTKDVTADIVPIQENQGNIPYPDICIYHAQRVELSMDNISNFVPSSDMKDLPNLPEIRLTEEGNCVHEAGDNSSSHTTQGDREVKLRPKTKPKCKFNRISSTISIFEGHNANAPLASHKIGADSKTNFRRLKPCDSESKMAESDKRKGVVVMEGTSDYLGCLEKSLNHHAKQQSLGDLTGHDIRETFENMRKEITSGAEDNAGLFQNEAGNVGTCNPTFHVDQILAKRVYPINTAHTTDDGEVNSKFQNLGQTPRESEYQHTQPDVELRIREHLLSGSATAAGSHSENYSQEMSDERTSQEGNGTVKEDSKSSSGSVLSDRKSMPSERSGRVLENSGNDMQDHTREHFEVDRFNVYDGPKGVDLPSSTVPNVTEEQLHNKNVTDAKVMELQSKPRRYKSPARDSNSFVTPSRYQTREERAQTREARTHLRRSRSHSRESPARSHGDQVRWSSSPDRQSRSHSRSSMSPARNSPPLQSRKSRSLSRQISALQCTQQESQKSPAAMTNQGTADVETNSEGTDFCPMEDQAKPQPSCRKTHSFSEVLSKVHSNIGGQFNSRDQCCMETNSTSLPRKTKEPPAVAKKPKHRVRGSLSPSRKSPPSPQTATGTGKGIAETCPNICSESPSRELRAFSQSPTMASQPILSKSQSVVDKTPTPAVLQINVERQHQSSRLPRSCEQEPQTDQLTSTPQNMPPKLERGRMTKRMKSPVSDIFPNKLSVASMDTTRMGAMSPERREAEKLYERALAELSFDQGEEDDNDTTLIATSENSTSPFYTPSASRVEPGFESPRTRLRRSASLPTADFAQGNEAYVNGVGSHSPKIIIDASEDDNDDDYSGEPDMGHTPFATPEWSPDSSSVQKRRNLNTTSQNEGFFTPARPCSYQNAMAKALLSPGEDPWSPFTGPVHHIVLPRQQSMVDIPFNCPEDYIDDDPEALKYHTIGRCQTNLMAECPRLQRNPSFYAAQKKAIPLAVSATSHISSPILEEQSNYDDDVFTSSGSSDRSFEKTREVKSPGIIKRMLRRHRSFNDRDKDRKELGNTSSSKDQSFFKFPALKSILRRGSKDLIKLAEIQKDSESVHSNQNDVEQAPLAKFQRDSDIDSVPGSPYASSRRLRRSLTAGELTGFRGEKRASLVDQIPVKYNTFLCSDDDNDNENDSISIQSLNASPIHSPTPCPPLPSRQKPYSRSSSFSVHFTDQSHTEEYSDSDKLPSSGESVPVDPLQNHFLHRDVTSSNSNDSGIQNDSSTHSSNESLKGQQVVRREMSRRHQERPKSDCSVRWAHNVDTSAEEDSLDGRQLRRQRPRTERTNSDLGDLTTLTMAVQQFNQLTKMPHSLSMKNIRRKKFIDGECGGKSRRMSTPHPIKSRQEKPRPDTAKKSNLHRSLSMPVNLDKLRRRKRITSFFGFDESGNYCSPDHYSDDSSDESENSMEIGLKEKCHSTRASHVALTSITEKPYEECLTYAEALWDHVTMDPEELGFRAGDVIEVTDTADKDWWWGAVDDREGWFPAAFVRLRANQGQLEEEEVLAQPIECMETAFPSPEPSRRLTSTGGVSREQARTNVINEILQAEKDYVKHLHDVIEGYIHQARRHPAMFSESRIRILFGNLEDIYNVSKQFVTDLEKSYNSKLPHLTEVGQCFLNSKKDFEIYSDYCNNHPDACKELQELYRNKRYRHFFEACRLLQEMIQIPLEGFLLTPVQKICKYPLQLSELLKFTDPTHNDYNNVCQALDAMKRIACLINERKRKMESIAKISAWQQNVEDWEGSDLLEMSSELIASGEAQKINRSGRSQERTLFLFDHQLIYCKKDLLRRNGFCYKGRVSLDHCELIELPDGKDLQYNVNVKNAWKLHDRSQDKWFLFLSKTPAEREKWIRAFAQERRQVKEDQENEFTIPRQVQTAVLKSRAQLDKPKGKPLGRRMSTAGYHQKDVLRNLPATLPRNMKHFHAKKKGWFNFMGKKTKT